MDRDALKLILQSFREGLEDENDPVFRDALAAVAQDPELSAWFKAEQEFDSIMTEKFRAIPVDAAARKRLMQMARGRGEDSGPNEHGISRAPALS
ncbi:MAG: hypothetical protein H0X40_16880 [Chthoniobacterales bacterium]|nr:hypothetical protein [Chthoniobacterales bacterium]